MKVLHVIPWLAPRYGGPALQLPQAAVELTARGHEVQIVTTNVDGRGILEVPTGRAIDWLGATATFHPLSAPRWYLTSWSMLADLWRRTSRFDVVHIHCLYRFHGIAAAICARRHGVPYVIQARGTLDPWHRRRRRIFKNIYHALIEDRIINGASAIICTSERESESIRELGYVVPRWLIPNGVDIDSLRNPAPIPPYLINHPSQDGPIVTFIGRLSEKKGVPLLVQAFITIAAEFPTARLVVAGPDDEGIGSRMAALVTSSGTVHRVSFVGPIDQTAKAALLQRSHVFVLPSADESFGNAVSEAMAVGCPVVVTPDVAIENIVRSTDAGLVCERKHEAIANAMATLIRDPTRAKAMGEAGRRAVDERYAWDKVSAELSSMYQAIAAAGGRSSRRGPHPGPRSPNEPRLQLLRCPRCGAAVHHTRAPLSCSACDWVGSEVDGVPILLPDVEVSGHDELDHHSHSHKAGQAAHFDRAGDERFESQRPHGEPRLYGFLLAEKFRRAVAPIRPHVVGASALTVCGGSGMDAEFLSRAGAAVVSSDLSLGAAIRAKIRSDQLGLGIQSIVADVECLPFDDQAIDLVAVHDGLHHLDNPYSGLSEMARVARRWVIVTEPAKASITRFAVRLGIALDTEEAGNAVARMDPQEVASYLQSRGFSVLKAGRYAMYYPHRPGRVFKLLSQPGIYPLTRLGWRIANALVGRFGNKMVVIAERVGAN